MDKLSNKVDNLETRSKEIEETNAQKFSNLKDDIAQVETRVTNKLLKEIEPSVFLSIRRVLPFRILSLFSSSLLKSFPLFFTSSFIFTSHVISYSRFHIPVYFPILVIPYSKSHFILLLFLL